MFSIKLGAILNRVCLPVVTIKHLGLKTKKFSIQKKAPIKNLNVCFSGYYCIVLGWNYHHSSISYEVVSLYIMEILYQRRRIQTLLSQNCLEYVINYEHFNVSLSITVQCLLFLIIKIFFSIFNRSRVLRYVVGFQSIRFCKTRYSTFIYFYFLLLNPKYANPSFSHHG